MPLKDPIYILSVVLLIVLVAPIIAKQLNLPPLVVTIICGTILGSNVLGIIERDVQLIFLEKIGLLYIMLLAGIQMDLANLKQVGIRSVVFGLLTFLIPLATGVVSGQLLSYSLLASVLLAINYSPHVLLSYPMMTRLGIGQLEAVGVAVGGTVVTSILTLISLSIVQAIAGGNLGLLLWLKLFVGLPVLTVFAFGTISQLGKYIINSESESLISQFVFILSCLFVCASATLLLGVDSIVGAFIAGLALNPLVPMKSPLMEKIGFVGQSLFIPAFLISVGVLGNPKVLFTNPENLGLALIIIVGAVVSKFIAAWLAGKWFKYSFDEVMVIFALTISRAALILVIALFGKEAGLLNEGIFNAIIVYILLTCLLGPLIAEFFGKRLAKS